MSVAVSLNLEINTFFLLKFGCHSLESKSKNTKLWACNINGKVLSSHSMSMNALGIVSAYKEFSALQYVFVALRLRWQYFHGVFPGIGVGCCSTLGYAHQQLTCLGWI